MTFEKLVITFPPILAILLSFISISLLFGCSNPEYDSNTMREYEQKLSENNSFRYPLDNYFPEIPLTLTDPPKGELHHAAEDSFAPAGTPVYAIGDGLISYSGHQKGYGWLIIIDHPIDNVYSLYGHLSTSRWKKKNGSVKKGDLIGFIGEADECYTMISHIHFGLRLGQRDDYLIWGDGRWTAGYTSVNPQKYGWFIPSRIIGETDSIRAWHTYIRKRENVVYGRNLRARDFKITSGMYNEKQNLDEIVENEFGAKFRLADWNDILPLYKNIKQWADSLGLLEGEENSLLISRDGYRIWLGRQYYISRFNHSKPDQYLSFDSIGDEFVCLGSWNDLNKHVLAIKK